MGEGKVALIIIFLLSRLPKLKLYSGLPGAAWHPWTPAGQEVDKDLLAFSHLEGKGATGLHSLDLCAEKTPDTSRKVSATARHRNHLGFKCEGHSSRQECTTLHSQFEEDPLTLGLICLWAGFRVPSRTISRSRVDQSSFWAEYQNWVGLLMALSELEPHSGQTICFGLKWTIHPFFSLGPPSPGC